MTTRNGIESANSGWGEMLLGVIAGLLGVAVMGVLDGFTGGELFSFVLYLVPIGVSLWLGGRQAGLVVATLAAGVALTVDLHTVSPTRDISGLLLSGLLRLILTLFLVHFAAILLERTRALAAEVKERQHAQTQAQGSEQRLRLALRSVGMITWEWDTVADTIHYSDNMVTIARGKDIACYGSAAGMIQCVHPEDRDRIRRAIERTLSGETHYECDYRVRLLDGTYRWIFGRGEVVARADGKPTRLVGISLDIHDRKEAELRHSTLAQALESTAEVICITDLQDRFTYVNRAFEETYGFTAAELLGRTPEIIYAPDNLPGLDQEIYAQSRAGGWRGELLNRRKDGRVFPISLSTAPVRDPRGQTIGLVGVACDISERKRAEQSARELAALVEHANDAIVRAGLDGRILSWNRGAERMFGYTAAEAIGQTAAFLHPPERLADFHWMLDQFAQGKSLVEQETLHRRKDGTLVDISLTMSLLRDATGRVAGVLGIGRDVSARKRMERRNTVYAQLGQQLSAARVPEQAARVVLDAAFELLGWEAAYLDAYSPAENRTQPILTMDTVNGRRTEVPPAVLAENPTPLTRRVMTHGACLINRTERLAEAAELTTYGNGRRAASLMYVPIHSHHTVIGILSLQSYTPGYYSDDDLKLLQALADRCGAALERMQMTEAVRLSEERFRALLETLPIGVALRDANGQLVHANPAYQKMLGYTTDELRQLGIAGIVHPQDVPAVQRLFDTLRQLPHEESQLDLRYRHKDGHVVWGRIWASAIPGADGTATSIVAVVQDVTERRQMELALQERAAIVDHAPDAIIITALDGRIQTWNRAAGRLYGYSEQEVLGRAVSLLCPPERHKEFMILAERMHHGEAIMDFETLRLRKDGTRVEVSLTLSALAEPNGARCGAIGITRDISERKRLEREIAEISRQEQQRLAHELHDQLGAYLAGVAFHVKSHAETLERRADAETPVARELVQMINAAITKTRQFARLLALETGDETMQLADRLSQLQAELQTLFGVTCCLKVSPDLPSLPTDFTRQICLIAREAVRNAIQHGQARFITCTALASPDSLELQIDSDGAPWSPANSAAPGLGLRIMRYRADALGGTLSFPTRDDQRTAVVCTVPLPFSVANASTSTPATP